MTDADEPARHVGRPVRERASVWILVGCTVVGVWLGVTAPERSPVTPAPPPVGAVADPGAAP